MSGTPVIAYLGGGVLSGKSALYAAEAQLGENHIFERRGRIFQGATAVALQSHQTGLEYPADQPTGSECIEANFVSDLSYQNIDIHSSMPPIWFAVSEATAQRKSSYGFDRSGYEKHMAVMQADYRRFREKAGPDNQHLFADPDKLFEWLSDQELKELNAKKHVIPLHCVTKSIETRFDIPHSLSMLEEGLRQKGVNIHTNSEVKEVTRESPNGKFLIHFTDGREPMKADIVVDCAWDGQTGIKKNVPGKLSLHDVRLRGMLLVNTRNVTPELLDLFIIDPIGGEHAGMCSRVNSRMAYVYIPMEGMGWQGSITPKEHGIPAVWSPEYTQEMAQAYMAQARKVFPALEDATFMDLMIRPTVVRHHTEPLLRRYQPIAEPDNGFFLGQSFKLVYSTRMAIEMVERIRTRLGQGMEGPLAATRDPFDAVLEDPAYWMDRILKNVGQGPVESAMRAARFLEERGLPLDLLNDQHYEIWKTQSLKSLSTQLRRSDKQSGMAH